MAKYKIYQFLIMYSSQHLHVIVNPLFPAYFHISWIFSYFSYSSSKPSQTSSMETYLEVQNHHSQYISQNNRTL